MPLLQLKNLFLSSFFFAFICSCSPVMGYKYIGEKKVNKQQVAPVINAASSQIFKTRIKIYNRSYSGLIILKQTSHDTSHLTFITEIGMKMFDFSIVNDSLHLNYVFQPLNQPRLITLLYNDMQLLTLIDLYRFKSEQFRKDSVIIYKFKKHHRQYYKTRDNKIAALTVKGILFKKIKAEYNYQQDELSGISLRHKGFFPLRYQLTRIQKTEL